MGKLTLLLKTSIPHKGTLSSAQYFQLADIICTCGKQYDLPGCVHKHTTLGQMQIVFSIN